MNIVAIKDCSAGNDTVGDMWKETKIFDFNEPIINVMKWAGDRCTNIIITVPENDSNEFSKLPF